MVAPLGKWSHVGGPDASPPDAKDPGARSCGGTGGGIDPVELQAAAQRLARQALSEHGHSADLEVAQFELLSEVLGIVRDIRDSVLEVAEIVQNGLADTGQEGVMDNVNATLPQRDRSGFAGSLRAPQASGFDLCQDGSGGVLTASEIASLLRVDRKTVHRWLADGELPAPIAVRGIKRWRRSVIEGWLREREGAE